jgi:broad-specificity NMP kinase
MKTSVLVTAVAGTGKSTTCKALGKLGYDSRDIESIEGLYELVDGETGKVIPGNLDQIQDGIEWNCNKTKIEELVASQTTELTFYCGGMANTEDVWDVFDLVVILTVSDETTVQRLSTRTTGEFGSTKENRDWVLSWKHEVEQRWLNMGGIEVNAEASSEKVAQAIVDSIAASTAHSR